MHPPERVTVTTKQEIKAKLAAMRPELEAAGRTFVAADQAAWSKIGRTLDGSTTDNVIAGLDASLAAGDVYDAVVARWNGLVKEYDAIVQAEKDARQAARELAAVRKALCGDCFTVHAGECA